MSQYYKVDGDSLTKQFKECPNCGNGYYMGKHKNREVCGNCGHTEFTSKPKGKKK